jgi:hypothetical protein
LLEVRKVRKRLGRLNCAVQRICPPLNLPLKVSHGFVRADSDNKISRFSESFRSGIKLIRGHLTEAEKAVILSELEKFRQVR